MHSRTLLLFACAITVPGCDQSRRTVGRSYNECLLINPKSGAGGAAGLVYQACRREFDRPKALLLEGTVKLVKPSYGPHRLEDFIRIPSDDEIATTERMTITFYKDASAKEDVATYSWDLTQDIEPNAGAPVTLNLDTVSPSDAFLTHSAGTHAIAARR